MQPIIKWTGGKRRELKHFMKYIPHHETYCEPFIGGGATYFSLNNKINIINDYDQKLVNFYNIIKNNSSDLMKLIKEAKKINNCHDDMEKKYYEEREKMNSEGLNDLESAFSFLYVNQLSFSGMRRFSKEGKFNVPFGHYKSFNPKITLEHIELLKNTEIKNVDALELIPTLNEEKTFIFLDPPYTRTFKEYSPDNVFGVQQQKQLRDILMGIDKSKWMLVIDYSELIQELYKNSNIKTYELKYGVNIKNRFNTKVEHAIITNY
jgi:DNA adenine methylase